MMGNLCVYEGRRGGVSGGGEEEEREGRTDYRYTQRYTWFYKHE